MAKLSVTVERVGQSVLGEASTKREVQSLVTEARKVCGARIRGTREALIAVGARDAGGTVGWIWEGTKRYVPCTAID